MSVLLAWPFQQSRRCGLGQYIDKQKKMNDSAATAYCLMTYKIQNNIENRTYPAACGIKVKNSVWEKNLPSVGQPRQFLGGAEKTGQNESIARFN